MRRSALLALAALTLAAAPLAAQNPPPMGGPGDGPMAGGPPPGPPMGPPPPPAADLLLGHTGQLKLSDQQVVRLAAISRRASERRESMRPAAGQQPDAARMRQQHEQMREQDRADLRDALAVLTADQQARAWEMMSMHHGPGGPGGRMMRGGAPGGPPPADDRGAPPPPRPRG
jgi:hypothetical protein